MNDIYTCKKCNTSYRVNELKKTRFICVNCGFHFRIPSDNRIEMVVDRGTFVEWEAGLIEKEKPEDYAYEEKLREARDKTGLNEAIIIGEAKVFGISIAIGVCDSRFIMGSMGYSVGERIVRLFEKAGEKKLPVFLFCCSGGARMQEGILALMQMEKTASAIADFKNKGGFYCAILTDPITGGAMASFAMLGDVIMIEKDVTAGFAGERVIRQTTGEVLPEGFQTSEFIEKHGFSDGIVQRKRIRQMIFFLAVTNRNYIDQSSSFSMLSHSFTPFFEEENNSEARKSMSPWEKVKEIRGTERLTAMDYIDRIFDVFVELKGDRLYRDDPAVVGGIALLNGVPVTVIAEYRGENLNDSVRRNFGMPMPEGYRKAIRLMKQAERFSRPIITFVNTPGAYCGRDAEERGQGAAIADSLLVMSELMTPILSIIIGEGGSGGALALAVGNEVWMLENATYSILSPEGYASIIWKDASRAEEAAEKMNITAGYMKEKGVIDKIIPEFGGARIENADDISNCLKDEIIAFLNQRQGMSKDAIKAERKKRFRNF